MKYQILPPPAALQAFVRFFWVLELDSPQDVPVPHLIIPNACPALMFHYGDSLAELRSNQPVTRHASAVLSGQVTRHYTVIQPGITGLVSVVFEPHALAVFLNIPTAEFTDQSIDLSLILREQTRQLTEQIGLANGVEARIRLISKFLLNLWQAKKMPSFHRIDSCMRRIKATSTPIWVQNLADQACYSPRQFDRVFKAYTGLSPRELLRIIRFQRVFHRAYLHKNETLTELALACGYYDQAHFNHEFSEFTGQTPGQVLSGCSGQSDLFLKV